MTRFPNDLHVSGEVYSHFRQAIQVSHEPLENCIRGCVLSIAKERQHNSSPDPRFVELSDLAGLYDIFATAPEDEVVLSRAAGAAYPTLLATIALLDHTLAFQMRQRGNATGIDIHMMGKDRRGKAMLQTGISLDKTWVTHDPNEGRVPRMQVSRLSFVGQFPRRRVLLNENFPFDTFHVLRRELYFAYRYVNSMPVLSSSRGAVSVHTQP